MTQTTKYDMSIHQNPDADAWAKFFLERNPNTGLDLDDMRGWFANAMMAMHDHAARQYSDSKVVSLYTDDGRNEKWEFPDGTIVVMTVPKEEQPITVKHAVYCLSEIIHRTHEAMK